MSQNLVDDNEIIKNIIAGAFDHPSVFMGGPSPTSRRRADRLLADLANAGYLVEKKDG